MCGRFSITKTPEAIKAAFDFKNLPNLPPRYNVAPTQSVAAVRLSETGERELAQFYWGLIPHWAKDGSMASKMINARAETVAEKPAFREAISCRRCLIPSDGFYEWRQENGKKQAFRIGMKGGALFGLAGLFEQWRATDDSRNWSKEEMVETVTIITTQANDKLRPIHHRMPLIVPPEAYQRWLDPKSDLGEVHDTLATFPGENMAFYRVGSAVNNVRNDGPQVLEPLKKLA